MKIKMTRVYRVQGTLVVADDIHKAVDIYRAHYDSGYPTIKNVEMVESEYPADSTFALMEDLGE